MSIFRNKVLNSFLLVFLVLMLIFSVLPEVARAADLVEIYIHDELIYGSEPVTLRAIGLFRDGSTRDITREGFWFSDNTDIADVDGGVVTFKHIPGTVSITFAMDMQSITKTVVVGKINAVRLSSRQELAYSKTPIQLEAELIYTAGAPIKLDPSKAAWFSTDPDVAIIGTDGKLTFGGRAGTTVVGVVYISPFDNQAYRDERTVNVREEDILAVDGRKYSLQLEGEFEPGKAGASLVAVKDFGGGETAKIPYDKNSKNNVQWSSSNPEVAVVDKEGRVTFTGKPGLVSIIARFENQEASRTTYIEQKIMQLRINESLNYSRYFLTAPPKLTVSAIDNAGTIRQLTDVIWSSSNEAVATIDEYGQTKFSGREGSITFSATHGELSDSVTTSVSPEASRKLDGIKIKENLFYDRTAQLLSAYAVYDDGSTEEITLDADWSSSNPEIATVQRGMVFFTGRPGQVSINCSYEGRQDSVNARIAVRPSGAASLDYLKFADNFLDRDDNNKTVRVYGVYSDNSRRALSGVKFHSYQPNVADIKGGRLVIGQVPGTAVIEASYQGLRTTLNIEIKSAGKQIEPLLLRLSGSLDDSRRIKLLSAYLIYADGRTQDVTTYATWNTGNTAASEIVRPGQITISDEAQPVKITASFENKSASLTNKAIYQNGRENPFKAGIIPLYDIREYALTRLPIVSFVPAAPDLGNHWAAGELNLARRLDWVAGYPDGTVKPDQRITRAEFAALLDKALQLDTNLGYVPFTDIKGHWAEASIRALSGLGIIPLESITFKPQEYLTRGEMALWLANFLDIFPDGSQKFPDVPLGSPLATAISKVEQAGVMSGMDAVYFRPAQHTTRAQAAGVLLRMLRTDPETALALQAK